MSEQNEAKELRMCVIELWRGKAYRNRVEDELGNRENRLTIVAPTP